MKNFTFVLCLFFCIQIQGQKKADTTEKANAQYESTKELITSGNFLFVADRAMLMGGGSVSMVTNFNQLMFREGKADISLPYFGTVWGGGGYSHKPVIKYEGTVENYELDFNDKKRKIQLKFDLKSGPEIHNVVMTIRRRAYTSVHVKSSGRSSITYDGYTKPIPEAQ